MGKTGGVQEGGHTKLGETKHIERSFRLLGLCIILCLVVKLFFIFCMKTAIESLPRTNCTGKDKYLKAITFDTLR